MILCDNIVFELQAVGGVSKYWSQTIARLDRNSSDIAFLEGSKAMSNFFRSKIELVSPIIADYGYSQLRRLTKPKIRSNVFHSSYYRLSRNTKANVVTIHDFMNEKFPSSFRDTILARMKKRACINADAIVVVSDKTRKDLLYHYPFVDAGKVHLIYNGVDNVFYPEPLPAPFEVGGITLEPKGYLLYVGSRGFCKNFPYALEVLAVAWAQGMMLPLIVVGGGALSKVEWDQVAKLGLSDETIVQLSGVEDTTLRRLYSNCLALLIPSIYEGFGLPAAEAARCGALVLCARGSALDEIVGETDYAFDLKSMHEPERVLALGLDNARADSERERLRKRSEMFDWDTSARKLLEIYDDI